MVVDSVDYGPSSICSNGSKLTEWLLEANVSGKSVGLLFKDSDTMVGVWPFEKEEHVAETQELRSVFATSIPTHLLSKVSHLVLSPTQDMTDAEMFVVPLEVVLRPPAIRLNVTSLGGFLLPEAIDEGRSEFAACGVEGLNAVNASVEDKRFQVVSEYVSKGLDCTGLATKKIRQLKARDFGWFFCHETENLGSFCECWACMHIDCRNFYCRWLETCNAPLWIVFWDCGDFERFFGSVAYKPTRISDVVALLEGGPDTGFVLWRVVLLVPSSVWYLRSSVETSQTPQLNRLKNDKMEHCLNLKLKELHHIREVSMLFTGNVSATLSDRLTLNPFLRRPRTSRWPGLCRTVSRKRFALTTSMPFARSPSQWVLIKPRRCSTTAACW